MWKCHPGKWLVASPIALLPFLAAVFITTPSLNDGITVAVKQQVSAAGADWAKLTFDGRDVNLGGDAPSEEAIDKAVSAIKGTYGVRAFTDSTRVVAPPPVTLLAPTIESIATNNASPEIKGTWQQGVATTLAVTLAGKVYTLDKDPELTSKDGNWLLKLAAPLGDGNYDVTAQVTDGVKASAVSQAPAKIVVDTVAPIAAKLTGSASTKPWPYTLTGTWPEGDAVSLVAKVGDTTWTANKDDALKSDGKGNWSFAPAIDLKPGSYDVTLESKDAVGNITKTTLAAAIVIPEPPAPVATPVPAPVAAKEMTAPTVKIATLTDTRPTIEGTWCEVDCAKALTVTLDGKPHVFGTDPALTSDGNGNWTLKTGTALKDGSYDVSVESADAQGRKLSNASGEKIVIDTVGPATPTVVLYASEESPTSISGTWAEGDATTLKISIPKLELEAALPDATNALQSDGKGNWTFAIPKKLEPGSYDIVVETTDANKRKSFDQTKFEINVKAPPAPPPPPPVIEQKSPSIAVFAGETSPTVITGTWDEANAKSLKVSVSGAGIAATKDTDSSLTSTNGAWSLALAKPLLPGIYNVIVESTDAAGKIATDATTAEIYIKAPPPPPEPEPVAPAPAPVAAAPAPAPAAPAFDCEGAFAMIATKAPIRFEFDRTRLIAPYDAAVSQYADVLKNPDCASLKVEIAGHADYFGPKAFNLALSELRAQRIVRALGEAGIDTARLSTAGLSELQPLDAEKNKDARSKNRRVELKLVK